MAINRDVIVAIILLAATGVLWFASFDIREPDYGQLSPATWPRIILALLTLLSLIFLLQSARAAGTASTTARQPVDPATIADSETPSGTATSPNGFYHHWKNVIWCFVLFGLYLYSLPMLGMLVGALTFVFLLLNALGGWQPRKLALHAVIAVLTVGGMWSLFTYALGVLLPTGSLFEGL